MTANATEELPPIQSYEIIDFVTIVKAGAWWSVAVLLRDTTRNTVFMSLYKFQKKKDTGWVKKNSFRLNNINHVPMIVNGFNQLMEQWKELMGE